MDRKKKLAVGKGVSVGRSVEEIIVTRALNDVPDTVALPLIGRPRAPQQQLLSRSMSRLPSRTGTDTGGIPQVDDWNGADGTCM